MAATTLITPKQYADLKSCTPKNIWKKIRNGNITKDEIVVKVIKYGRFYLIEVNTN